MATLLQIDFPFQGPFGDEMSALSDLARSINDEPGLSWKIRTGNVATHSAGGIYPFADEAAAAYLSMPTERLAGFGITDINAKPFAVNTELTAINHGPLA